jgi:hypothetical protein
MASNMVPDYEVKILMNPSKALGSDNELKDEVSSTFSLSTSVTKMNVQFLDTDTRDIYNNGWSPRIRKMEGASEFELTYKKRYPINGELGDSTEGIEAALATARTEGFDSTTSPPYDAQIEVGFRKQTLSISYDASYPSSDSGTMDLPLEHDSCGILSNKAPEKFNNGVTENWGIEKLAVSRVYGPILARRWSKGKWDDIKKLSIEVWRIKSDVGPGTEYIVEASFKVKTHAEAVEKRNKLVAVLQSKDWFLAQDSLKTTMIMARY